MDNFLFWPRALAAALFDASYAVAMGALVARLWLIGVGSAEGETVERLRRMLIVGSATMVVVLPCMMWLTTATMISSSSYAAVRPELWDVLTGTHAGKVLLPDFALAALLLALALAGPLIRRMAGVFVGLGLVAALTAFRSATGHAAGDGDFSLPEAMQFLHLGSIAIWAGGVVAVGWVALPGMLRVQPLNRQRLKEMSQVASRLSTTSTWAVGIVALTGIYNAWRGLGLSEAGASLKPLGTTQWGLLLTGKSLLVAIALGLGVKNRLLLQRNEEMLARDAVEFGRSMRLEAWVMVAILAVSGFLANSPPAISQ